MDWIKFSERLKTISHLKLVVDAPIEKILVELNQNVDSFERINLNLSLRGEINGSRPWFGRGLVDYKNNSRHLYEFLALKKGEIKLDEWGDVTVHRTELADLMPDTMRFVHSLVSRPRITRFLKLPPSSILPWHSHCQSKYIGFNDYKKMVLQIPIITNEKVINRVRPFGVENAMTDDKVYQPGEVWLFNSWDEHCVENMGNEDRIILYIEAPLYDPVFFDLVERSLTSLEESK